MCGPELDNLNSELISFVAVYSKAGSGHRGRDVEIKTGSQIMGRASLTSEGVRIDFPNDTRRTSVQVAFQSHFDVKWAVKHT